MAAKKRATKTASPKAAPAPANVAAQAGGRASGPADASADFGSPASIASAFARRCPPAPAPSAEPVLSSEAEHEAYKRFTSFVWQGLRALFGHETPRPRAFDAWSPEQRAFLTALAATPPTVIVNGDDVDARLRELGAVSLDHAHVDGTSKPILSRYVGLAPGPLDRAHDGAPLWLLLRRRLMGELDANALSAIALAIPLSERLALAREVLAGDYHLLQAWPLRDHSPDNERQDTTAAAAALEPLLDGVPTATLDAAFAEAIRPEHPPLLFVLWLALAVTQRRASPTGEPSLDSAARDERAEAVLASALDLSTYADLGRDYVVLLGEGARAALLGRLELRPHNLGGGWPYLDLMPTPMRSAKVAELLEGKRALRPACAERLRALARADLDQSAYARIALVKDGGGPNAKLAAELAAG